MKTLALFVVAFALAFSAQAGDNCTKCTKGKKGKKEKTTQQTSSRKPTGTNLAKNDTLNTTVIDERTFKLAGVNVLQESLSRVSSASVRGR